MWRRHESYGPAVSATWVPGCVLLEVVHSNLKDMQVSLRGWERDQFGSVRHDLSSLRRKLEEIRARSLHTGPSREEQEIMRQLAEVLAREEIMEKQRSRVDWLQAGDRNTGFFHAKARQRARTNKITALKWPDGSICTDQYELECLVADFYKKSLLSAAKH